MNKKFYLTTAIAYTSGKPHIGNTYEIVLADAIARYKRLQGYEVYFQTGTDEHGQKIEQKAIEANMEPQVFVDKIAEEIKSIWDLMNTSYDKFVRTTNPVHKQKVAQIFKKLYDQGDIYLDKYEGLYCTPCESFFTESQLIEGKCPDCGRAVSLTSEDAYFFKLSNYVDRLVKYYDEHPGFIEPLTRKNEIINNFIKTGLQDLCVSRTSFKWGVPVSFDDKHVVYVWIDALSNYITFLGYDIDGNHDDLYNKLWPADLHIVGKDILRFHMIYWPIILIALGEEPPKKIYAHSWYLMGDGKMSKSKGNVVYADELVKLYGVDAVRYYLLSEMPFANDGIITEDLLVERINSDLANTLGNLVNRTIAMSNKYFSGEIKSNQFKEDIDEELISLALNTVKIGDEKMNSLHVSDALNAIMNLTRRCNKYIDETMPWILAKDEAKSDRLGTVLYNLLETIRIISVLLQPFMPETAEKIFKQLNTEIITLDSIQNFGNLEISKKVNIGEPLFMRIDK
ncbi:MAG: methionine--tRNA ligase [Bacilli bacterium]|nr:methionine--tRNA ligase [Bacilli bacterium]MDD3304661.1 methionine--tRNA ligase [Bacilli bacterium]MDD4053287.1 methionine--tRNA ligase [Bacilli bacterium]MDD4411372.1 methionine--tRNA ligase [Bacilli bacterium]